MKKLLLVAVSVGVFLLVTITAAIIVLTPKIQPQEFAYSSSIPYGRTQPAQENLPPIPAVIGNNREPIVAIAEEIPEPAEITDRNNGDNITIGVRQPTAAAVPDTRTPSAGAASQRPVIDPAQTVTPVRQPGAAQQTQNTSRTQAAGNTASSSSRGTTASRTSSSRQTTAPRTGTSRTINDFWVQTGAFSSMVRAEDAKELLAAKGLVSIIDSRIVNGQHFYRVRLGPYTTQNEADHWLGIVKVIDGFQSSQVRQTSRGQ